MRTEKQEKMQILAFLKILRYAMNMEGQTPDGVIQTEPRKVPRLVDRIRANSPIDTKRLLTTVAPDVLDNFAISKPPKEAKSEDDPRAITEQLLSVEARKEFLTKTRDWEVGKSVGVVAIAGFKDTCTAHPHVYEIIKTAKGVQLFFVDPEPNLKHKLRPPIVNLLAAEIHDDDATSMDVAFLRYRTPEFNPAQMTLAPQYAVVDQLITDKGKPSFLNDTFKDKGAKEEQILFRLSARADGSALQMRYATQDQMDNFLQTGKGQPVIEEKIRAGRHIMARFMPLLGSDDEFHAAHFVSKQDAISAFERFRPRFKSAVAPTPLQMSGQRVA